MRLLVNNLQQQKTILILTDSNTSFTFYQWELHGVLFYLCGLVVLWNKGILRTSEKGKN